MATHCYLQRRRHCSVVQPQHEIAGAHALVSALLGGYSKIACRSRQLSIRFFLVLGLT